MLGFEKKCPFCSDEIQHRILMEQGTVFAIEDLYPVTQGHLLVVPRRHTLDYFTMTDEERFDAQQMLLALREQIMRYDSTVQGFNIGVNCGPVAGQSILHAHIHLIPRREGIELFNKHFDYLRTSHS
ncbi:HIT family protein [Oryzomonas japonica]|uniref:HIT family protein n=1 Tax=Oryzomonas japonica TaxID=2603858 RepID=A0A7J4ZTG5_9BACT|nr:HIT family protein [Oryzomonas japonica]KAB0666760.1 HIT family protein [Oryzomonas japonica]